MGNLSPELLGMVLVIAGAVVLCCGYVFAGIVRDCERITAFRLECQRLIRLREERVRELEARRIIEVEEEQPRPGEVGLREAA
jgi:hypothetical protein